MGPRIRLAGARRFACGVRWSVAGLGAALLLAACARVVERRLLQPTQLEVIDRQSEHLKVHLRNGDLCILQHWDVSQQARKIVGTGTRFDPARHEIARGQLAVPLDSVVLLETNVVHAAPQATVLAALTVVTAAVAVACLTDPKACFGSCPTFYATIDGQERLVAEAFSASVAPVLEAVDVDALPSVRPSGGEVALTMRNEAYETHVVRSVRLLAMQRPPGGRIFAGTDGNFWVATNVQPPDRCLGPSGDCSAWVCSFDGREYCSAADSTDLAAAETLTLHFDAAPAGQLGVVVCSRQSLLPTYLFYQSLAWLGTHAGEWLAALQRGDPAARAGTAAVVHALGGIDVAVRAEGGTASAIGRIAETGPLATDTRVLPLTHSGGPLTVTLRMAKGAWRIDGVALARLERIVEPVRVPVREVRRGAPPYGQRDDDALRRLLDPDSTLVTLPGDIYTLRFALPQDAPDPELFLETKGYYLEWMREEWLAEEDAAHARALLLEPQVVLRELAPRFKRVEASMESLFWSSRYEKR
jgi:hypothetical protein